MRRTALAVLTLTAITGLTAGVARADVTDVVAVPSVAGALTVTGAGLGTLSAPLQTSGQTIGSSAGLAGSVLTVTDATGSTVGWDVTATYGALTPGSITPPNGLVSVADIGAGNVTVAGAVPSALATTNAVSGVASPLLSSATALTSPVQVARSHGDGRGVTVFNTSYAITLPAKTSSAATLYTGKIVYTVAPAVVG